MKWHWLLTCVVVFSSDGETNFNFLKESLMGAELYCNLLQGTQTRFWSIFVLSIFFYLQCLSNAYRIIKQNLECHSKSYKQDRYLTIFCYLNKACARFIFTIVQYTGRSSSLSWIFLSATMIDTFCGCILSV